MIIDNIKEDIITNIFSNNVTRESNNNITTTVNGLNEIYEIELAVEHDMYEINICANILSIEDDDKISYAIEASTGDKPTGNIKDTILKIIKWLKEKILTVVTRIKEWIVKFINWITGNKPIEKVIEHLDNLEKEIDKKILKQRDMDEEDVKYITDKIPVLFTNAYDGSVKTEIKQDKEKAGVSELEDFITSQINLVVKSNSVADSINNNIEKTIKEIAKLDYTYYNKLLETIMKIIDAYKIGFVLALTPKEAVIYKIKEKKIGARTVLFSDYKSYNLSKIVKNVKSVEVPRPNDIKILKSICKKIVENKKYLENTEKELDKSFSILKTIAKEMERVTTDINKINIMKNLVLVYQAVFINSKRLIMKTVKSLMLPTYIYDYTKNITKYYSDGGESTKDNTSIKFIENKS